jgi:arylsulfatase A-like enzyme
VDVVPTVLDLLGHEAPLGVQGQSLAPALRADPAAPALRPWALTEYRTGFSPDLSLKQIQDGRYKLTWYGHDAFGELFDLVADPHELGNRFHDPACAGVRRELQDLLLRALQETDDPLPPQIAFA